MLLNPANRNRAVALSFEQFPYGFANAVDEDEARALYDEFHVAGSGIPVFQAAFAKFNAHRGPGRQRESRPRADADHLR